MYIILSQRKDIELSYSDDLYSVYHFPARYKSQIKAGDVFVYYQGDRYKREHRVYFGTGVVKNIYTTDGESYYAELSECKMFEKEVPIYMEGTKYVEQLGFNSVRKSPTPPWQSSIRPLSEKAYRYIIEHAGTLTNADSNEDIEDLKVQLKNAIKGFYLNNDKDSLRNARDIIDEMMAQYSIPHTENSNVSKNESLNSVTAIIDYCRSMRMSYSYKPVLILATMTSNKYKIKIDQAVSFFRDFYEDRRINGQKIERQNCIYQDPYVSDERIAENIVTNPVKALVASGYFVFDNDSQEFSLSRSYVDAMTVEDVEKIRNICFQKLHIYFSSLGK